jgi:AAHS family 4-hydroxybenzoate transporter-like MFS transporter
LIAASLIPRFGWQSVFVVGGVGPIVIAGVALIWLPESIRFLLVRGADPVRVSGYLARIAPHATIPREMTPASTSTRQVMRSCISCSNATRDRDDPHLGRLFHEPAERILPEQLAADDHERRRHSRRHGDPHYVALPVRRNRGALILGKVLDWYRSFMVLAICFVWAAVWIFVTGQLGASVPLLIVAVFCSGLGVIGGQTMATRSARSSTRRRSAPRESVGHWASAVSARSSARSSAGICWREAAA